MSQKEQLSITNISAMTSVKLSDIITKYTEGLTSGRYIAEWIEKLELVAKPQKIRN